MNTNRNTAKVTDTPAVEAMLTAGEGRSTAFCVWASEVANTAKRADKALKAQGLLARQRTGAVATLTAAGPWAKSYNGGYGAKATKVTLRRFHDGWRLTKVERVHVRNKASEQFTVAMPVVEEVSAA